MLNIKALIDLVNGLRGLVTEPVRSEIAHRMAAMVAVALHDSENYKSWLIKDKFQFFRACDIVNLERWVPDTLQIEPTKLSEFCSRWMSCNLFRLRNDPSSEWRPITPEQNSLRVTMVEELQTLALDNSKK